MNRTILAAALTTGIAALSACGGGSKDPNALTAEDNRQLDNAAQMLDASPDGLTGNADMALGNGDDDGTETGDGAVVANEGNTQ